MASTAQRLGGAIAFAVVVAVLSYFLPSPHPDRAALVWPVATGLVVGYLMWPAFQSARDHHRFRRPTAAPVLKALLAASLGTALLAYFQSFVLHHGLRFDALLVSFLFIGSFAYVNSSRTPHLRG